MHVRFSFPICPACQRRMTILRQKDIKFDGDTSVFECPGCKYLAVEGAADRAVHHGRYDLMLD